MRNEDNETEILLGNKQLLGIFFVVAVLLGVAFTGGYMVGHGSSKKGATTAAATTSATETTPANTGGATGGETHSVGAEASGEAPNESDNSAKADSAQETNTVGPEAPVKPSVTQHGNTKNNNIAAERARRNEEATAKPAEEPAVTASSTSIVPHSGQTFLQVAAVGRDEAEAVADVLHKKGFRAHAVPKPGNVKIYRVLIGPIRDTSDLSATRDSLRRTGFRDVIVQHY